MVSSIMFLDYSCAFNTVDHEILLKRCQCMVSRKVSVTGLVIISLIDYNSPE